MKTIAQVNKDRKDARRRVISGEFPELWAREDRRAEILELSHVKYVRLLARLRRRKAGLPPTT